MNKIFYIILSLLLISTTQAALPLPADQAFHFTTYMENDKTLIAEWHIAPGYYLYRDKVSLKAASAQDQKHLGPLQRPDAQKIILSTQSQFIPKSIQAYQNHLRLSLPLKDREDLSLIVKYQGCAQDGFCYAPEQRRLELRYPFSKEGLGQTPLLTVEAGPGAKPKVETELLNSQAKSQALFSEHFSLVTLSIFLGLGLLLAFTPCSLPMIPILSSLIVGQKRRGSRQAFLLSLAYVLGLALAYALAGLLMAWLGSSVQVYLQNPWMLSAFAAFFVILAFSLLGFYELRLPKALSQKLNALQGRQAGGTLLGAFLMGSLSALVVSPCVTAPLLGVLTYVSESGDLLMGAAALFALGLGMGLPLLLIGFSFDKLLPKAGLWMNFINRLFAFMLLGLAIYLLARVIPSGLSLFLWAVLLIVGSISTFFMMDVFSKKSRYLGYVFSSLALVYGMVLFMGIATNQSSPLYPFEKKRTVASSLQVKNMLELEQLLAQAKQENKPVLIDFYAEWCESCKALDEKVFSVEAVKAELNHFMFIRANVTENNDFDQALSKRYNVLAPPTFVFINRQGQEEKEHRIVGEVGHEAFLSHAKNLSLI